MTTEPLSMLQLQYGVNAFADDIYNNYQPLKSTAYYPDPEASELKKAIAAYVGCDEAMVLCGNGSDELIDLYLRIHKMQTPGLKVAIAPPAYYQYDNYGSRIGAVIVNLPHDRTKISPELLKKHGCDTKNTVVMLDSPANPSGDMVEREQFIDLLEAGYQVFADEAYYEYCGKTVVDLVATYPTQLVVSRSLSKAAAISGSRVGYMIAAPAIIEVFRKQKLLFNVGSESQHRGLYALKHMDEFQKAIAEMRAVKQKLVSDIQALGSYRIFPSLDIYTIFSHMHMPTEELQTRLENERAIQTHRFANFKGHDVIRTAVLKGPVVQRLIDALHAYA